MYVDVASLTAGLLVISRVVSALPAEKWKPRRNVELGPRPEYLVNDMDEGPLKDKLASCLDREAKTTKFSIGHRGGAVLQFPEETVESIRAGTRMGAGILECDVAFTADRELVCRHAQCDLHTTTNIVNTPLGAKCTAPFTPASNGTAATAECCTSDITLAEFKTLCGKMDGYNASATTPEDFLDGTLDWRTNLYAQCGTVMSHKEFIALVDGLGLDFTSELKLPQVEMPFDGDYTQEKYAQQMIDEYKAADINPSRVWPQSFTFSDIAYWLEHEPEFGRQAVLLDESGDSPETFATAVANLTFYKESGVQIVAPPLPYLVTTDENDNYIPSDYATTAKYLGLDIITWSLERSPPLKRAAAEGDYYYMYMLNGTKHDGDIYELVHVLSNDVGVLGIFSDWSATVTYYANCFGLF
ncbi:putative glycerophosphoryl diester phosphodiesterase family protein [Eutypa lata UCREL1]|uniref:glycerophosphodiester phosphodiesterase n=1 Tax=Eutypa lata (strain UCR-EL1) TaxID=1287681 RepID=M7SI05_EUTLA|nr:putative glycerophosphoryl diester phosphodiesterase family protein [Eutypa lata UCREL1]